MAKMRSRRPYVVFDAEKLSKPNFWQCEVNIPTELLRTFVAVYELGSFTKAAQLFDLTQPAVSAHMRKLEVMLGGDLIEKKSSGINLTARGEQALKSARRLLAINDELVVACGTRPAHHEQIPIDGRRIFDSDQVHELRKSGAEAREDLHRALVDVIVAASKARWKNSRISLVDISSMSTTSNTRSIGSWPKII